MCPIPHSQAWRGKGRRRCWTAWLGAEAQEWLWSWRSSQCQIPPKQEGGCRNKYSCLSPLLCSRHQTQPEGKRRGGRVMQFGEVGLSPKQRREGKGWGLGSSVRKPVKSTPLYMTKPRDPNGLGRQVVIQHFSKLYFGNQSIWKM